MDQYLDMFLSESYEHLETMSDLLMQLEQGEDPVAVVKEVFRSAHTLKGMSATMGFQNMSTLTHQMENLMDLVRNEVIAVNEEIVDALFACVSALEQMVASIENGQGDDMDVQELMARLQRLAGQEVAAAASPSAGAEAVVPDQAAMNIIQNAQQQGLLVWQVEVHLSPDAPLKAVRAFMVFQELEDMGDVVFSHPGAEEIQEDQFDSSFLVWLVTSSEAEQVQERIAGMTDVVKVEVKEAQLPKEEKQPAASKAAAPAAKPAASPAPRAATPVRKSQTLRVDIERVNRMMNLLSEVVIDRSRLGLLSSRIGNRELQETVEHMTRLIGELQDVIIKLRMVPVETLFNRFPRMVRDLSKDMGKKVELQMTGLETELDRTVVDEMADLLVHLIRNSLDHGIEKPDVRIQNNKPETGTISISAYQRGNSIMIEIQDDGKGIDREVVFRKAVEKGLAREEEKDLLTDEQVYQFLFMSGFSTAEKVSDVSGRGVGLDAVKSKIESLGGSVHVQSKRGEGSTFILELPLTLSIIQALLIRMGKEMYALPLAQVIEIGQIPRQQLRRAHHLDMVPFRGEHIPLISLHQFLEVEEDKESEELSYVVVQRGRQMAALSIDEAIAEEEIVVKSMGPYLGERFGFSGATIMSDGTVALILDGAQLIRS